MSWKAMAKLAVARTAIGGVLGRLPLMEKAYARRALWRTDHAGLFMGVYDSYAAAAREIPASRKHGWDNEASASIWLFRIDHMQPTAYTPFFWLSKLLQPGMTLVDYGGGNGLSYHSSDVRAGDPAR